MVLNITTIHFHYQVVTILGSEVHFKSSDVHYSVFTVYVEINRGYLVWLLPRGWLLFEGVVKRGFTVFINYHFTIIIINHI